MYTPGSLPPTMYSDGGGNTHSDRTTSATGASAHQSALAVVVRQRLARRNGRDGRDEQIGDQDVSPGVLTTAASASAMESVRVALMTMAQKARSAGSRAARRWRSRIGRRNSIAPGK